MMVSVVSGGWSVKGDAWDLSEIPGFIIAVNDAALYLPRVNAVVSMDRLWTENRWEWMCEARYESHIRVAALKNVLGRDLSWLHPFQCDYTRFEFSTEQHVLNGTNSGLCAFNAAFKLMPDQLFLYGFDMRLGPNGEQHWYPDYSWKSGHSTKPGKLKEWASEFHVAARQCKEAGIKVWNMSTRSLITDFELGTERTLIQ